MTANANKQAAMDTETAAWRKLSAHLAECPEKDTPRTVRHCAECSRLHAAHRRACEALHRPTAASFANLAGCSR